MLLNKMFLLEVFLFRPFFQQASPAEVNSRVLNPTCFNNYTIKTIWASCFMFDVIYVKKKNLIMNLKEKIIRALLLSVKQKIIPKASNCRFQAPRVLSHV